MTGSGAPEAELTSRARDERRVPKFTYLSWGGGGGHLELVGGCGRCGPSERLAIGRVPGGPRRPAGRGENCFASCRVGYRYYVFAPGSYWLSYYMYAMTIGMVPEVPAAARRPQTARARS
eukprot:SAG31_NODE_3505_length_4187_cov_2.714286_8_plen_120_part_00